MKLKNMLSRNMTWKNNPGRRRESMSPGTGSKFNVGIGRTILTKTSRCSLARSWMLLTGQPASCTFLVLTKIGTTRTVIFSFIAIHNWILMDNRKSLSQELLMCMPAEGKM
jgi:hypothetical protein